jgi:hypothetical protein
MHPVLELRESLPAGAVCVGIDVAKDKLDLPHD